MRNVAIFQTDLAADFQAPSGLETLGRYDDAVLQAEMETVTANSSGRLFANSEAPATWLRGKGVVVWDYINPFWSEDARVFGGEAEAYRKARATVAPWLKTTSGDRIPVYGGKMWAIDITNEGYLAWLVQHPPVGSNIFVDAGFYHTRGYHAGSGGPDNERASKIRRLYSVWRSQGKRLMVNAGWEALDPHIQKRTYPFAEHVDGVAFEVPGGQGSLIKWKTLVDYSAGAPPTLDALRVFVDDWLYMGKTVWVIARWQRSKPELYTYSPFPTFGEHASFWREACASMGCDVAVYASPSRAEWNPTWTKVEGGTTEHRLSRVEGELTTLSRRLSRVESALSVDTGESL